MKLKKLSQDFSVCKISNMKEMDFGQEIFFLCKTDQELSLVCETSKVPPQALEAEHGWKALRIEGILDFGMVGVIAQISGILAKSSISLFVVSTFNTDYILLKAPQYENAIQCLLQEGYEVN